MSQKMAQKIMPLIEIDCSKNATGRVDFHATIWDDSESTYHGHGATLETCLIDLAEKMMRR